MTRLVFIVVAVLLGAILPARAQEPTGPKRLLDAHGGVKLDPAGMAVEFDLQPLAQRVKAFQSGSFPSFAAAEEAAAKLEMPLLLSTDAIRAQFEEFNAGLLAGIHFVLGRGNGNEVQGKLWMLQTLLDRLLEKRATLEAARRPPCDLAVIYVAGGLAAAGADPKVPQDLDAKVREAGKAIDAADAADEPYGYWMRKPELLCFRRLDRAVDEGIAMDQDEGLLAAVQLLDIVIRRDEIAIEVKVMSALAEILCGPTPQLTVDDMVAAFKPGDSFENLSRTPAKLASFRGRLLALPAVAKKKARLAAGEALRFALFPAGEDFERILVRALPALPGKGIQARLVAACRSEAGLPLARASRGWLSVRAQLIETLYRWPASEAAKVVAFKGGLENAALDDFTLRVVEEDAKPPEPPAEGIAPPLRLEPAPDYYLALARAVRDLRKQLTDALGIGLMTTLARLDPSGMPSATRVNAEFPQVELLYYGLHLVGCEGIGLASPIDEAEMSAMDQDRARNRALYFCANWGKDPAFLVDSRAAVPLERVTHEGKSLMRAWVSMGVRLIPCRIRYTKPPRAFDPQGKEFQPAFVPLLAYLPMRIAGTVQVEPSVVLTPGGFSKFCAETYKTPNVKVIAPTESRSSNNKYSTILYAGCGLSVLLGIFGVFGSYYLKRSMSD